MVTTDNHGTHLFQIYLPNAQRVDLVGDFTNWEESPITMRRSADGFWVARVDVEPGDHLFSYLVDGRVWMPDYAASGVQRNQFGNWTSRLFVDENARLPEPLATPA